MSKNPSSLCSAVRASRAQKVPQSHAMPGKTLLANKWKEGSTFASRDLKNPYTHPSTKGNSIESDSAAKKIEPPKQPTGQFQKPTITLFNGYSPDVVLWSSKLLQEPAGGSSEVPVEENWDYEGLEEEKEATAGTVKVHALNSGMSSRRFGEFTMSARFPSVDEFERDVKSCADKCKCPKDKFLPCCKRCKQWIDVLYEKKGIHFEHAKYKVQYEEILNAETDEKQAHNNSLQIRRDLSRTYPECAYYKENCAGQKAMENVLTAYSKYDTHVGYVQGMNFVVGALLYHCSEEIAFWLFVAMVEDFDIRDVYSPGLPGLYHHTRAIEKFISRNFSSVAAHLVIPCHT
eukprot:TRINITY_DN2044_c0_g7_i2.p1 TRINITY_DN2044_c0_g7~~TRINITY_DN2044_c0_g7_i2.p1  ORF type:complete len:346 (+),score=81.32 TRINITY_DN2044_c0_g7_i2:70-1107(+)